LLAIHWLQAAAKQHNHQAILALATINLSLTKPKIKKHKQHQKHKARTKKPRKNQKHSSHQIKRSKLSSSTLCLSSDLKLLVFIPIT
jgi:hypothetical protein